MENRAYALTVGVFTLCLSAAILVAFWWFAGRTERTVDIELVTERGVAGLNEQAAVRFRGLRAGRVTDIDFDPDDARRILIRLRLSADVPLTRATRARLGTQGLTGFVFVQLDDDGSDRRPLTAQGDALPRIALDGGAASPTESALEAVGRVKLVADRLAAILDTPNQARIAATLANIEASSRHLEQTLARAPALLDRVDRVASRLDGPALDATLGNLQKGSAEIAPALAEIRSAAARVNALAQRWEGLGDTVQTRVVGDGGAQVGETLEELRRLSGQLSHLAGALERNPQALLFGRPAPQPGPGEAGYVAPMR